MKTRCAERLNIFSNRNTLSLSAHTRLITLSAAASLLLVSCSQSDTIESSLQTVQSIITSSNAENPVQYQLSYDADFPCKVSLQENWQDDEETDWQHTYRFDLTDIQPGTFVQSKSGRRAVAYTSFKVSKNKEPLDTEPGNRVKKVFSEKRINNIRYRSSLNENDQQQIVSAMDRAVALCEEEYLF